MFTISCNALKLSRKNEINTIGIQKKKEKNVIKMCEYNNMYIIP